MRILKYWVAALSFCGTIISLWFGLSGGGTGPRWLWIVMAFACLCFSFAMVWWAEWRMARIGRKCRIRLINKCGDLIVAWEELDRDYRNAPEKERGMANLPDPMDSRWTGSEFKVWPYRVGLLQGQTNSLREDLQSISIATEAWKTRISLPQLLDALRQYREILTTLN